MSEPSKRRWFQIHLSTAAVLMFLAGGLIWLNLTNLGRGDGTLSLKIKYGYPEPVYWGHNTTDAHFYWEAIAINLLFGLLVLFCVARICEFLIRRRESRKPPPETRN